MKIAWLHIKKFGNKIPDTRLDFAEGRNLVIGKNAGGKTTLLDILAELANLSFSRFTGTETELEYSLESETFGRLDIAFSTVAVGGAAAPLELRVGDRVGPGLPVRYSSSLTMNYAPNDLSTSLAIARTDDSVRATYKGPDGETVITGKPWPLTEGRSLADSLFAEITSVNQRFEFVAPLFHFGFIGDPVQRFDESLGYYQHIFGPGFTISAHKLELKDDTAFFILDRPFAIPSVVSTEIIRQLNTNDAKTSVRVDEQCAGGEALTSIRELLDVRSVVAVVDRVRASNKSNQVDFGNFRLEIIKHNGEQVSHRELSYGQKRIVSFLLFLSSQQHVIIADELVNGLHHSWIEYVMGKFANRQSFLTSQNPLLFDHLEFDSPDDVRRRIVKCEQLGEQFFWRNIKTEDARQLYSAMEAGIQHVGEIMRDKGVW